MKDFDQLVAMGQGKDLNALLKASLAEQEMGVKNQVVHIVEIPNAAIIRQELRMTQEEFSVLLDVPLKTLREWEQKRRTPTKPAQTLLKIARLHPEVLREISEENTAIG
ncbi:helix-turn-helix domain-containing protein [Acinetobacter higginsii]|uniref:helix-turn-helix domain-containing protein n=1 Tax=Acinetobacter higginsii TaxID=70347 RepID=UPI001F612A1B|nr:helix-turn-helix domain-containing protein [Acinetobacter higginsii]MCI3878469.1 transcriptional regulator [Acinetobacter higginsii]